MAEQRGTITVRQARETDWPHILEMEQEWKESQRAAPDQLRARLDKFPQGIMLAWLDGIVVATLTSVPIVYRPAEIGRFSSWAETTNRGLLHWPIGEPANALYIVSGIVRRGYHDRRLFETVINHTCEFAAGMGLKVVLAGARLPAYRKYVEQNGPIPAEEYAFLTQGDHMLDPLLEKYRRIGFRVPGPDHVKAGYYPDEGSMDYAAIVVRELS